MRPINEKVYLSSIVFLFLVYALFYSYINHFELLDDAYISMKYAANAARGYGLVYNKNEKPVEGYSNFLLTVLYIPFYLLKIDLEKVGLIQGIIFGVFTLILTYKIGKTLGFKTYSLFPCILLAVDTGFVLWAVGGLETLMFTFFATYSLFLFIQKEYFFSGLLCGITALTRADGFLIPLGILVFGKKKKEIVKKFLFCFLLIFLSYYLWRFFYYGYPFPNTYYCKVGHSFENFINGVYFVFGSFGFISVRFISYLLFLFSICLILHTKKKELYLPGLFIILFIIYVCYIGGDWRRDRFLVPILPWFYIIITYFIVYFNKKFKEYSLKFKTFSFEKLKAFMLICFIIYCFSVTSICQNKFDAEAKAAKIVAGFLKKYCSRSAVIAVIYAGVTPYYSDLKTIDVLGLNDLHIGHLKVKRFEELHAGHRKFDYEYVVKRKPDFIIIPGDMKAVLNKIKNIEKLRKLKGEKIVYKGVRCVDALFFVDGFRKNYKILKEISKLNGWFLIFMRKDSKALIKKL